MTNLALNSHCTLAAILRERLYVCLPAFRLAGLNLFIAARDSVLGTAKTNIISAWTLEGSHLAGLFGIQNFSHGVALAVECTVL